MSQVSLSESKAVAALEEAIDRFGGFILWYFEDLCRDRHEAENLSQQLWLAVFDKFAVHQYTHLPLLKRKAYQIFIDYIRKRNVRSFVGFSDELPESPVQYGAGESLDPDAEARVQARFWEHFPDMQADERQKEAFWLKHRYGFTIKEVSEKLGVPHSTIHDWINAVKQEAQEILNREGGL